MSTEITTQPAPETQQEQPKQEAATAVAKKERFTPELCAATINKLPAQLQALKDCFAMPFDAFRKAFKDPAEADRIMAREIDFAAQAMMKNPFLIKVATGNPMSLVNAIKNVASSHTTLSPAMKLAYLVPLGGEIVFWPSYMALIDAIMRTGVVKKIEARCVYEGDTFEIRQGSGGYLKHIPDCWGKREKVNLKGAYYFAVLTSGEEMFDTMSIEEIEAIRKRAPSAKSTSPWDTDYAEMCAKTLIRRAWKKLAKGVLKNEDLDAYKALFSYDDKVEQSWIAEQKASPKKDTFDEEEVEFEEVR